VVTTGLVPVEGVSTTTGEDVEDDQAEDGVVEVRERITTGAVEDDTGANEKLDNTLASEDSTL